MIVFYDFFHDFLVHSQVPMVSIIADLDEKNKRRVL